MDRTPALKSPHTHSTSRDPPVCQVKNSCFLLFPIVLESLFRPILVSRCRMEEQGRAGRSWGGHCGHWERVAGTEQLQEERKVGQGGRRTFH